MRACVRRRKAFVDVLSYVLQVFFGNHRKRVLTMRIVRSSGGVNERALLQVEKSALTEDEEREVADASDIVEMGGGTETREPIDTDSWVLWCVLGRVTEPRPLTRLDLLTQGERLEEDVSSEPAHRRHQGLARYTRIFGRIQHKQLHVRPAISHLVVLASSSPFGLNLPPFHPFHRLADPL